MNPKIPNDGEVSQPVLSEDVASVQKQEENMEEITESVGDADGVRAEADEDVRRPKPAARPHTPRREPRSTSTKSPTCLTEAGVSIAFMEEECRHRM